MIAPALKEAELRVALQLTAMRDTHNSVRASSREIARRAGLARSAVVPALHSLANRQLIAVRPGSTTRAAGYLLNFLNTIPISTQKVVLQQDHPPVLQQDHPGPVTGPPLDLFQDQPGPPTGPPLTPPQQLPAAAGAVDIDSRVLPILDRLLHANPKTCDAQTLDTARRWLHGYTVKFGFDPKAHPPDDRILAQFLAVAPWVTLERLLYDLMAERKQPGTTYAWYIAVALQRIHGLKYELLRARRAQLKPIPNPNSAPSAAAGENFTRELLARTAAGVKRMK
mgnify:CR=1 FL=1